VLVKYYIGIPSSCDLNFNRNS